MLVKRNILTHLKELGQYFPVISLTGPRQAGKTTLLRELYSDYTYLSLEDPDVLDQAINDPRTFLKEHNNRVIFDEAQRAPELFSYLQTMVDDDPQPSRFILSGSQNFLLQQNITQSLAGRVGIAKLFPFDFSELKNENLLASDFEEAIVKGFYPALFDRNIPSHLFYPSYEQTYIERDVSGLISSLNLEIFRLFLRVCATYAGQLINYSKIARACGVSVNTITSWFSVLEQSYIIFRISPYFKNFGKRIIKSPKLYFYDTGLLCNLLEIRNEKELKSSNYGGALFENLIIADIVKSNHHQGNNSRLYFYRDSNQLEIDLLEAKASKFILTEIKSTRTYRTKLTMNLNRVAKLVDLPAEKKLIYGGDKSFETQETSITPWFDI